MRDTSKDDKISGRKNTYGYEHGDILNRNTDWRDSKYGDTVVVLRTWKYTILVRSLITGDEYKDYNWTFSPAPAKNLRTGSPLGPQIRKKHTPPVV